MPARFRARRKSESSISTLRSSDRSTAATVEGDLDAEQIHVAEGSLDHVSASFRAVPNGPLTDEATRIPFKGQAQVSGLRLADPALARAVGAEIALALRGSASAGGGIAFDALDLAAPDFEAHYSGLLSPKQAHGRMAIATRDLSRFALLIGGALKGEARLAAELDGAPRYGALTATVDAQATHLVTGFSILDRITGGDLKLAGAARTLPGGGFGFTDLVAAGQHGIRPAERRLRARQGGSERQRSTFRRLSFSIRASPGRRNRRFAGRGAFRSSARI